MPLLGSAAMLLSFDVDTEAIAEHDRWHTHEHLPERLAIPGFLRGTRWLVSEGEPRYMVLYEVESLETLTSQAYLARLDDPTPWTRRMMTRYRSMTRGLCIVAGSFGLGQGSAAALVRFAPQAAQAGALRRWLLDDVLCAVPQTAGLGSAHLLQRARPASMTQEQRIRGADRDIDMALIVTGYDDAAVAAFGEAMLAPGGLRNRGASELSCARYRWSYSLSRGEVDANRGPMT
jgi:hypothetical protein